MEIFPKWIVEQDSLIIQKCTFHKQIAKDVNDVKGGGLFYYLRDEHAFLLYGTSHDFGSPTREQLLDCIAKNNIGRYMECNRYARHKIFYSTSNNLEDALTNYEHLNECE